MAPRSPLFRLARAVVRSPLGAPLRPPLRAVSALAKMPIEVFSLRVMHALMRERIARAEGRERDARALAAELERLCAATWEHLDGRDERGAVVALDVAARNLRQQRDAARAELQEAKAAAERDRALLVAQRDAAAQERDRQREIADRQSFAATGRMQVLTEIAELVGMIRLEAIDEHGTWQPLLRRLRERLAGVGAAR